MTALPPSLARRSGPESVSSTATSPAITNLDHFKRKKVDGKTLITRKGSNERIAGWK